MKSEPVVDPLSRQAFLQAPWLRAAELRCRTWEGVGREGSNSKRGRREPGLRAASRFPSAARIHPSLFGLDIGG